MYSITNSSLLCRGGVMLVHDIRKNKTRVIDFQGSAPKTLKEEMLQNVSEVKVILRVDTKVPERKVRIRKNKGGHLKKI